MRQSSLFAVLSVVSAFVSSTVGQENFSECFVIPCQVNDDDGISLLTDPCNYVSHDAIWHDANDHCFCRETYSVGCNISLDCPGRCGPGCGSAGGGVYSLDCAEHDRCCRQHGGCWNPFDQECGDEYQEAADDFLFGAWNCQGCKGLDLVFVIDLTGSMWDDIAAVKAAATSIINEIQTSIGNYRISIVTYKDFPVYPYGDPGDYPAQTTLSFTSDPSSVISTIQSLSVGGGADWPESVYSALMHVIGLPWRNDVIKAAILMGDAPPHDPEPFTGYTSSTVIAASLALDPLQIYPIVIGYNQAAKSSFSVLAEGTEGKLFEAPTARDVVDTIIEAIGTIITPTNNPPNCDFAVANITQLWPPNHKFSLIEILGVTDPDDDPINIEVTAISQDEPSSDIGTGSGSTCPDGVFVDADGDGIPEFAGVRSERDGNPNMFGNGRVYTISFTASDGNGGTCSGTIQTCAPHDQGANISCVDDGPNYDSTTCSGGGALIERRIYSIEEFYQLTPEPLFLRGDIQIDYERDISDVILLLSTLFLGKRNLPCADSADINDDGNLDVSDAITLLGFLFKNSPFIPEPSSQIGSDPTQDHLDCSYE